MGLEYTGLAPGFVREVVDVYETWHGRETATMKVKELMMVLRIEVSKRYKVDVRRLRSEKPRVLQLRDTRLR